jgi:hypothetical protein
MLVKGRLIHLHLPVVHYWLEFGAAGKDRILIF